MVCMCMCAYHALFVPIKYSEVVSCHAIVMSPVSQQSMEDLGCSARDS
jgi:hypothetical protein